MSKLFVAVISVLMTTVACGMIYILFLRPPSPLANLVSAHTEKMWKEDLATAERLNRTDVFLQTFYREKKEFPETLHALEGVEMIEYFPSMDTNRYQLCANFQISSDMRPHTTCPNGESFYCPGELEWYHPAGRYCFTRHVELKRWPNPPMKE